LGGIVLIGCNVAKHCHVENGRQKAAPKSKNARHGDGPAIGVTA
jgi:hypothetical protein